jgi:hypothetical protein
MVSDLRLTALRGLTSAIILFNSAFKEWPVLMTDGGTALLIVRFERKHSGSIGISDNFLDPLDRNSSVRVLENGF